MATTLLIFIVALAALGLCWSLLRRRHPRLKESNRDARIPELDVRVLRTLLDHDQEYYLRDRLPSDDFRRFQRRRVVLALHMLAMAEGNCEMLVRLAQIAQSKGDAALTRQAEKVMAAALEFRLNSMIARYCLYLKWLLPTWTVFQPTFAARNLLNSLIFVQAVAKL